LWAPSSVPVSWIISIAAGTSSSMHFCSPLRCLTWLIRWVTGCSRQRLVFATARIQKTHRTSTGLGFFRVKFLLDKLEKHGGKLEASRCPCLRLQLLVMLRSHAVVQATYTTCQKNPALNLCIAN
jgi:hypothetical protein